MTNTRSKTSPEAEYDEILRKLDALLLRHQGKPSVSARTGANEPQPSSMGGGRSGQISLTAADNIPTLTEMVYLTPAMLSPSRDITSLIAQIVDSALKDAGADLETGARGALVRALESRLFGL
ncbi:MAG TPA: hypothetical protein VGP12_01655 [Nitrosospira sp.]|nr:hypothetical protein [Nitrosospira sp.]